MKRENGWSGTRAFELLREAGLPLGPKSRAAYLPLEQDKDPTPDQEEILARVFGWPEEPETPAEPPPDADLRDLIRSQNELLARQAAALERLATALEDSSDERLEQGQATALFLGVLARVLAPEGTDFAAALRSTVVDFRAIRDATTASDRGPG